MEENLKNGFNYDENDELSDEQYFADNSEMMEKVISGTVGTDRNEEMEEPEFETLDNSSDAESSDDEAEEYRVTSITETWLKNECEIKNELSKTEIKFDYRGETLKGVCMQKMPNSRWEYIFLVQPVVKGRKAGTEKKLRKINVLEATLL
jgi:hypothetical protein